MRTKSMRPPRRSAWLGSGILAASTMAFSGYTLADTGTAELRINIREGMGTNYPVVLTLAPGQKVDILEYSGEYVKVRTAAGNEGYLKQKFLEINKVARVVEPPPVAEPVAKPVAAIAPKAPMAPKSPATSTGGQVAAAAPSASVTAPPVAADDEAVQLGNIKVTGSRVGRADIVGALPVAVIDRADIDASGFTSVGELLRNTTFNSFGAFRAQSGSSAQSLVTVDLRGLGPERTLVLIDGRRAPKAPFAPDSQDLNSVPMSIVERIEILKDGASAIYGSDAIAGVINIITRKDFDGVQISYQDMGSVRTGGDSRGGQLVGGVTTRNGNIVFGASFFERDIIFARDSLFNSPGGSFFSNNYVLTNMVDADGDLVDDNTGNPYYGRIPGGCPNPDPAYYLASGNNATGQIPNCAYDFNLVAADEAATGNQGVFVRGTYAFDDDWSLNTSASVSRASSFGRYAPSLAFPPITVDAANPLNPIGQEFNLYHRFAGLGPRDNDTDANVYDLTGVFSGMVGDLEIDFGTRHNEYQFYELGRNYVVIPIASQYIADGLYDFTDPGSNPADVLSAMKATITRDAIWVTRESFAEVGMPLMDLSGGMAKGVLGVEYREEEYFDQYDSLQEAGVIGGSAGNSAGTDRRVKSAFAEVFMPVLDNLEVSLSGRFEDYNDVGSNFAPKASVRFQPIDSVTLRASAGQGFRAPDLSVISALPSFSAEPVGNDQPTCLAADPSNTFTNGQCFDSNGDPTQQQVNATIVSNPALVAEDSDQLAFGVAWDINQNFNLSLDFYQIAITNRINFLDPSEIIDRLAEGESIPAGLGVTRNPNRGNSIDTVTAGSANDGEFDTSGVDLEAGMNFDLGNLGRIKSTLTASYLFEYKRDKGRDEVGDPAIPQYRATLDTMWSLGDLTVALNGNHIADQAEVVTAGVQTGHIPSYTTWDVQLSYDLPFLAGSKLTVGAVNVLDREPSARSAFDGRDYNFYLYDQYGRQTYVKFTQNF